MILQRHCTLGKANGRSTEGMTPISRPLTQAHVRCMEYFLPYTQWTPIWKPRHGVHPLLLRSQAAGHHHDVQHAARKYLDQHMWDKYFKGAYIKLVTASATWSPAAWARPHTIYGRAHECASGTVIDPACAQDGPGPMGHEAATLWKSCKSCTAGGSRVVGAWCH